MSKALRCDICGILFEQPKYHTTTLVVEIDHESNLLKRTDCCLECAKHIKLLMTGLRSKVPTCMELFEREHPNLIPNAKNLVAILVAHTYTVIFQKNTVSAMALAVMIQNVPHVGIN